MILFDATATQAEKGSALFHGGGEYAKFILREAIKSGYAFDVVFQEDMFIDPAIEKIVKNPIVVKNFKEVKELVNSGRYSRFYSPLPYRFNGWKPRSSVEFIGVIHGIRRIELPWDSLRWRYFKSPLKQVAARCFAASSAAVDWLRNKKIQETRQLLDIPNARFITVSNHSKFSLLNFFPQLQQKNIEVFYSPFSVDDINPTVEKEDYFLMLSADRWEKNIARAVSVFDRLFSQGRLEGKSVLITGCPGAKIPFKLSLRNPERFRFIDYVNPEDLNRIYERAFAFVYPSLNEGFGYPPLMSMAAGVPVAASAATSIPEAVADAALLFCPTNLDDMANRILQLNDDDDLRRLLVKKGFDRVNTLQNRQKQEIELHLKKIFQ